MSNKILMVGALACLSAVAVAQSDQSKEKEKAPAQEQVTAPRDAQSGQASGKRMHKPMTVTAEVGAQAAEPNKPTGKSAMDDWQAPAAKTSQQPKITENNKSRVAAGDVNGDGKADVSAPASSSDVKSPRDTATGQSSGKRQHEPAVTPVKATDAKAAQK